MENGTAQNEMVNAGNVRPGLGQSGPELPGMSGMREEQGVALHGMMEQEMQVATRRPGVGEMDLNTAQRIDEIAKENRGRSWPWEVNGNGVGSREGIFGPQGAGEMAERVEAGAEEVKRAPERLEVLRRTQEMLEMNSGMAAHQVTDSEQKMYGDEMRELGVKAKFLDFNDKGQERLSNEAVAEVEKIVNEAKNGGDMAWLNTKVDDLGQTLILNAYNRRRGDGLKE